MSEKRKRKYEEYEKPTKKEDLIETNNKSVDQHRVHRRQMARELSKVELPKTGDGLTAEKLSAEQKNVFKKECQNLYGHKFSTKRKLPANSLESATLQLQAKMKEKAAQLTNKKTPNL